MLKTMHVMYVCLFPSAAVALFICSRNSAQHSCSMEQLEATANHPPIRSAEWGARLQMHHTCADYGCGSGSCWVVR